MESTDEELIFDEGFYRCRIDILTQECPRIFRSDSLSEFFDKEHPLGISGTCEMAAAASGIRRLGHFLRHVKMGLKMGEPIVSAARN